MKHISLRKHRQLPLALVCACAPLVLLGCGGGSSPFNPSPTATPTVTTTSTATPTGTTPTATPTGTVIATATPTGTARATATPTFTPQPTATRTGQPAPTATSTPGPTEITVNLTFTKSSDSNFIPATFTTKILDFSTQAKAIGFTGRGTTNGTFSRLNTAVFNPRAGLVYRPTSDDERNFLTSFPVAGGSSSDFYAESGTITVTSFTSNTVNLRYDNVVFIADSSTLAKGRVTVNGTINGPYTTDGAEGS